MHDVREVELGGVPVRVYRPQRSDPAPGVVYFHGGGWVLGGLDTLDGTLRRIVRRSGCVVFNVDYRRAPEVKFPGPLDDCCAVARCVFEQASEWGVDASRVTVGGDSAGGNLAAATCLRLRNEGGPLPARQLLIYPVVDSACDAPSYREFAEGYGLTAATMRWFWRQYLPDASAGDDPLASLAHADDLHGLPPADVLTAEYDVLRDEGETFAERLRAAGVDVAVRRIDGAIHGFFHLAGVFSQGAAAVDDVANRLSR